MEERRCKRGREGDLHIHVVDTEERRMPFPHSLSLSLSLFLREQKYRQSQRKEGKFPALLGRLEGTHGSTNECFQGGFHSGIALKLVSFSAFLLE